MKRSALFLTFAAMVFGAGLAVSEGSTLDLRYQKRTSLLEGKAVCSYNLRIQDAANQTLTFTLIPAPTNALGENGGEIKMVEPAVASTGQELACEAYLDTTATATVRVPDDDHTVKVTLQLHSHPDNDCHASGVARGKVRMHVPNPGTITQDELTCDSNESRGNVRSKRKRRARNARTGARTFFVWEVINDGPGAAESTTVTATLPANAVFVESATLAGIPCPVRRRAGPPAEHVVECEGGTLLPDERAELELHVIPRRTGSFTTTIAVDAANNGPIHSGTDSVGTDVAQGVRRILSVTAKARNGGDGSVNISPDDGVPQCTAPLNGNNTTQCLNTYDNNTSVTLTAKPGTGSSVVWEGACAGTTGNTCTLTRDSDKSATVRFKK